MPLDRSVPIKTVIALFLLGGTLLVLYRAGQGASGVSGIRFFMKVAFIQSAIYLLAAWIVSRARASSSIVLITIVFAVIFRLSIIFAPPYLSDDIYRYIWDGRVQSAGINPYQDVPANESLAKLRDDRIYPKINRRGYARTIYPPVAEGAFFLTTRFSEAVTWIRGIMVGCEAITVWAVIQLLASFGLARQRDLIYAWHPLAVW